MGWGEPHKPDADTLARQLSLTSAERVVTLERALCRLVAAVEEDRLPDLTDRRLRARSSPVDEALAVARQLCDL